MNLANGRHPDHKHTCCKCGRKWNCRAYTLRECQTFGVFNSVKVNKGGPYCEPCRCAEMAKRNRAINRANLAIRKARR